MASEFTLFQEQHHEEDVPATKANAGYISIGT